MAGERKNLPASVHQRLRGSLGNARIALQIDVGFGDIIVPEPKTIAYPVLLEFPAPELKGYSKESTIAEKFHAMAQLGILNSRMKDFYDIWFLSRTFDFQGAILSRAIAKTFANRGTPLPAAPAVFDPAFVEDKVKIAQWRAFLVKSKLDNVPATFAEIVAGIRSFIQPIATALHEQHRFQGAWKAPGPWRWREIGVRSCIITSANIPGGTDVAGRMGPGLRPQGSIRKSSDVEVFIADIIGPRPNVIM